MNEFDVNMPDESAAACVAQDFGAVRLLFMNQQQRRNALSLDLRTELQQALEQANADDNVRSVVITGAGGHFCSGGDITSMNELNPVNGRPRLQRIHALFRQIHNGPKPVLAAVEGAAAGAGLSLASACDIIISADDARFGIPFNRVGLMPDVGVLFTLPQRIGMGRTRRLAMTSEFIDPATAERWGLVEEVVPSGTAIKAALHMATTIASGAPVAQAVTKQMLSRLPMSGEQLLAAEVDAQSLLFATQDFAEGRDAFLAKRSPAFTGK